MANATTQPTNNTGPSLGGFGCLVTSVTFMALVLLACMVAFIAKANEWGPFSPPAESGMAAVALAAEPTRSVVPDGVQTIELHDFFVGQRDTFKVDFFGEERVAMAFQVYNPESKRGQALAEKYRDSDGLDEAALEYRRGYREEIWITPDGATDFPSRRAFCRLVEEPHTAWIRSGQDCPAGATAESVWVWPSGHVVVPSDFYGALSVDWSIDQSLGAVQRGYAVKCDNHGRRGGGSFPPACTPVN